MLTEVKKTQKSNRYYRHGRFAIPADSRAALDFYLQHLLVPHSRREMLMAPLARQSRILGQLFFAQSADLNGREAGTKDSILSSDYLAPVLSGRLESSGIKPAGEIKLLLLGDYAHSARGQSVVFVFDDSAEAPLAVAKIGSPAHGSALKKEFQTLSTLARIFPPEISRTIPKPFDLFEDSEFTILLESALPGSSVHFELRNFWTPQHRTENHFSKAFEWLTHFHRATSTRKISFGNLMAGEFEDCFKKLQTLGETSKAEDDFIRQTLKKIAGFEKEEIRLSALQGDFWTRNILVGGERIGVVDWEHARAEGCPLEDAFMFAISYGRSYPWKFGSWLSPEEAFRRTFYEKSRLSATVAAHLRKFCRELGATDKLLEAYLAAFLARQAIAEASEKPRAAQTDKSFSKEVKPWRNLFRAYAAAKKNTCFG